MHNIYISPNYVVEVCSETRNRYSTRQSVSYDCVVLKFSQYTLNSAHIFQKLVKTNKGNGMWKFRRVQAKNGHVFVPHRLGTWAASEALWNCHKLRCLIPSFFRTFEWSTKLEILWHMKTKVIFPLSLELTIYRIKLLPIVSYSERVSGYTKWDVILLFISILSELR